MTDELRTDVRKAVEAVVVGSSTPVPGSDTPPQVRTLLLSGGISGVLITRVEVFTHTHGQPLPDAKQFALWNAIGGIVWPITVTLLGYGLGSSIKSNSIDKFILPVIFVILVISVIPLAIEIVKSRRESKAAAR